uniref:ConoCAP n=1 Tax=Conus villepinii TaxID=257347 RepID=CCAP_CONVL|nr:RecName: Full=ConoCAP; Contains: RecName: Full=ConoCAP-a; AltName: Full=CCAP-vil; Contains: RecName: Full=ConoCAP-b; Contains: RecName: Full=ConoCAP-c; Flags: Precursor [Conus villepinii]CBM40423.1 ConoCAP protein [Conus villepinii]
MVSLGHVLFVILLPVLLPVAADDPDDQMLSQISLPSSSRSEYDDNDVSKRVFCNGFTGCGGRHRDRSRRQERYGKRLIPVLAKRPFCNSFGCYNGKRSLSGAGPALSTPVDPSRNNKARTMARMLDAAASARHEQQQQLLQQREQRGLESRDPAASGDLSKRLFCNGYGGCRGGKRTLYSPWLERMNEVADDRSARNALCTRLGWRE